MMQAQGDLFGGGDGFPTGFRYQADVLSPGDENDLVAAFSLLPFQAFEFRGFTGRRRVVSFGYRYDFAGQALRPAPGMPPLILALREKAGRFAGIEAEDLAHVLITEYTPGAAIGWHRDRPEFGRVVGLSLLSEATLRFRMRQTQGFERVNQRLAPRSAYLLDGPARTDWEHSIPGVEALRYSVTFRTLRQFAP